MPTGFPGDSPTPVGRPRVHPVRVTRAETTRQKNTRLQQLKEELVLQLDLIVDARDKLEREFRKEGVAGKFVTKDWISRLKDLTSCFNSVTESKIRVEAAERKIDKDLTPAEEREAVIDFVLSADDSAEIIKYLVATYEAEKGQLWKA